MRHQHKQECNELLGSISEYVDGSLHEELCRELEHHLSECEDCRVVVNTMKKTIELYQTDAPKDGLPVDVRQRLYKTLHLDDLLHTTH
ncbi:MAG: zf-HC2 domain-containing protein [Chloroflexi bacterium]|nr:zf-HC2 domain-containing protein [Chloroflexota bacterium]